MDPDANLQEQERLLQQRTRGSADRGRLRDLREALWRWLNRRGHEPRWSECPRAAVHFKSYGGSNVAGWKAAALLCLLLPAAAAAQQRTVYTDRDPATGAHLQQPVAVQRPGPVRVPPPELLVALKAREYVAPPEWPDGPVSVTTDWHPWMDRPGYGHRLFQRTDLLGTLPGISFTYGPPYGGGLYGHRGVPPMYGPLIINSGRGVHSGRSSRRR